MKIRIVLLVTISSLFFTNCSPKVYFTSDVRERIEKANISLEDIQYYNEKKITLKRELASGNTNVQSGKVKIENGKYIHYIILKPKTPGVCGFIYTNKLSIAFEHGPGKSLDFGKPNSSNSINYQLFANEWINHFGEISYEGKIYYIMPQGSSSKLMIKKDVLNKIDVEKRRMKGVKLE